MIAKRTEPTPLTTLRLTRDMLFNLSRNRVLDGPTRLITDAAWIEVSNAICLLGAQYDRDTPEREAMREQQP